jgi:hypothetical protein
VVKNVLMARIYDVSKGVSCPVHLNFGTIIHLPKKLKCNSDSTILANYPLEC